MKRREAPLVKVPLVIPRKKAFPWLRRDRIIVPTLMLILPDMPPGALAGALSRFSQIPFAFRFAEQHAPRMIKISFDLREHFAQDSA
jgi:hypothetical protein